jgi:hypothetical protein
MPRFERVVALPGLKVSHFPRPPHPSVRGTATARAVNERFQNAAGSFSVLPGTIKLDWRLGLKIRASASSDKLPLRSTVEYSVRFLADYQNIRSESMKENPANNVAYR